MTAREPRPRPHRPADGTDDDPVLLERAGDDTDEGWSQPPEPDDDERLGEERPPHWQ